MPAIPPLLAAPCFLVALAVTLAAAQAFASRLDHVGVRLGMSEALLGLLMALAADAPELASAVAATARGERDVGLGVVVGSNIFNLAGMVGVGALVAGRIVAGRRTLAIEVSVTAVVTGATAAMLLGGLPPRVTLAAVLVAMAAYVVLLIRSEASAHGHLVDHLERPSPSWLASAALMAAALVAIVAGATAMVDTALVVAGSVGLPHPLVGLVVLAAVTSLPNVATAIRLARAGRGDATVSETMNSNTINLVGGVVIPAAVIGLGAVAATTAGDLLWLAALTAGTIAALTMRRGMGRVAGAALVAAYVAFLVVHV